MKMLPFKYLFAMIIMIPVISFANNDLPRGKYTKEKTIKKEFPVNMDALLKVNNSYGNLNITSWMEDRILIEVHIRTTGDKEDKVQQKLDDITVDFESTNAMVSAVTNFNASKSSWSWGWGRNNNVNMQVNYIIKVPVKNNLNLSNDYGAIVLDRIDGHAKISCDYGRLEIGELRGRNNQLSFDYTSRSTIGYINSGTINADYSGFTIEKAGNLNIISDYTNSKINEMDDLTYTNDYGKLEIGSSRNVKGNGDYINVTFGTVHGDVDIRSSYGTIKIGELAPDAGNVQIRTDYTGIKLGYAPDYHFNFEIQTEYAGVRGMDNFEIAVSKEKSTEKYYKGHYGDRNSRKSVTINSDYGGISFTKN